MGLIFLAICIAAAINLDGTLKTVAIVVAALNGLSMVGQMRTAHYGQAADASSALNLLTTVAGLGLLIYSFVA
jgi:hypothetical protein